MIEPITSKTVLHRLQTQSPTDNFYGTVSCWPNYGDFYLCKMILLQCVTK